MGTASIITFGILGTASVLASGILFRHQRMLTLLAAAGAIFELWWLVVTLVHRTVGTSVNASALFAIGSLGLLAAFIPWRRQWHWPYRIIGSGWRDMIILAVLIPILISAFIIQRANGLIGTDWVAHGYYNGDTATFIALVQRSLSTAGLVDQNPFAGNGPLEYPTLIHGGLAELITAGQVGTSWTAFLPLLVLIQILITVPLFFLLRDAVKNVPAWPSGYRWGMRGLLLEGILVAYVVALSWESYVYPQGHFFTTGLFMLLVALLVRCWNERRPIQLLWSSLAAAVVVVLVLSNSVTGTAAAVIWTIFALLRVSDSARPLRERASYFASIVALVIFFLLHTNPGAGHLSFTPWFSYTAAHSLGLLTAPATLLLLAGMTQLRQQTFIGVAAVALVGLGLITFLFSDRELIIDNASRFLYHGLLVGWSLTVDSCVRSARVLNARLRQLPTWPLQLTGLCAFGVILALLAVPALASVAQVHDHLLFKNKNVSNLATRLAMEWILISTRPNAIFLASPQEPWEIPLFTGRALLRTEYWLSPGDALQEKVAAAFAGDLDAQQIALSAVDYVLLKGEERSQWNLPREQLVGSFGDIAIYDVRPQP